MYIYIYIHIYVHIYMVVKIMVPFWIPIKIRLLIFRVPKKGHNFDNHPYIYIYDMI